jgi:hypothetical protein
MPFCHRPKGISLFDDLGGDLEVFFAVIVARTTRQKAGVEGGVL